MIKTDQETDALHLEAVKRHLLVYIDDDDALIQSYINASLGIVQNYVHRSVLGAVYTSTPNEITPEPNGDIILSLPEYPTAFFVMVTGQAPALLEDTGHHWKYDYNLNQITIFFRPGMPPVDEFQAFTGMQNNLPQIDQARMLLIGTFYAFREDTIALKLSELPTGVKMILDNLSGASL